MSIITCIYLLSVCVVLRFLCYSVCGVAVPMLLTAGECVWLDLSLIERVVKHSREMFPVVRYAFSSVPTYPSGTIGYLLASSNCVSCVCVCLRVYNTVEPGHVGDECFVHYSEVVPSSNMTTVVGRRHAVCPL